MHSEKTISTTQVLFYCRSRLQNIDRKLLVILIMPIILSILNDSWLFFHSLKHAIDPWIYFGYFIDLKQHLMTFSGTYFGTRLPWILPGSLAYQLFPPLIAAYVLHLLFYYAATISFYQILKLNFSSRAALLTTVFMGFYCYFLHTMGWDYIDGAAITYLLLTFWMFTRANRRLRLGLAGVFYGCMIYTQLFLVTITPLIFLYYLFFNRQYKFSSHLFNFAWFICGFVGITLLLGLINYFLDGPFFFFMPIIKWTLKFISKTNPWHFPFSTWWKTANWLIFPTITLFGSILTLIAFRNFRKLSNYQELLFFQAYFILTLLLFVFLEFVKKQPVLYISYYTDYTYPALFFAIGAQIAISVDKLSRKQFCFIFIFGALLAICSHILPTDWIKPLQMHSYKLVFLIGILAAATIPFATRVTIPLLFLFLAAFNLTCLNYEKRTSSPYFDSTFQKNSFLSVVDSVRTIQKMDPQGNAFFWFHYSQTHMGSIWVAVAAYYTYGGRLINEGFPKVDAKHPCAHRLVSGHRIFILTEPEQDVLSMANDHLKQIHLKGKLIDEKIIEKGEINYKITYIEICNFDPDINAPI